MLFLKTQARSHCFLISSLCLYLVSLYPGIMTADSETMYQMALSHQYSNHHPPLMAHLWHYLVFIQTGSGCIFLINMFMLWMTVYILAFRLFKQGILHWFCLLLPLFPQIIIYSGYIWKDVMFSFAYGLLATILAEHHILKKTMSIIKATSFLSLLFYATAIKYQAQFICPIILYGFFSIFYRDWSIKTLLISLAFSTVFIAAIHWTNDFLVETEHQSHSWQYRDIYDLAGMSIRSDQMLLPHFLLKDSSTTSQNLSAFYQVNWEPLIGQSDSPLKMPINDKERTALHQKWLQSIINHPWAYLEHRLWVWGRNMLLEPLGRPLSMDQFIEKQKKSSGIIGKIATHHTWVFHMLDIVMIFMTYALYLPVQFANAFICIRCIKNNLSKPYAQISLLISALSLTLVMILSVLTLAGVSRYIYFSFVMFILSCPYAGHCWAQWYLEPKIPISAK